MSLFRKRWRLTCTMRHKDRETWDVRETSEHWSYWAARFDAWYFRKSRPAGSTVMTQIDNLPR